MTLTGINFDVVQRSKGQCAVKIMAYDMCAAMTKHDGTHFDFNRKVSELVHAETMLPAGAPASLCDPEALANACELAEKRSDSQTGRLLLFTCPRGVPEHLRTELARTIAQPYVDAGMGVVFAYHNPRAADGEEQPHFHFFLTTRALTPEGLAARKSPEWDRQFREKVPATPDDPKPKSGTAERQRICDVANTFFARHDLQIRLDPRRLEQQGIDSPPEPDAPRESWQAFKRTGSDPDAASAPVARVLRHRKLRRELAVIAEEQTKIHAAIKQYEQSISLAKARTKTELAKPKSEETMSGRNANQWMFQDRGLIGLSPAHRAQAEQAYAAFKERYPDFIGEHTLAGYVDAIQAPMRRMTLDENPYDAEGNLIDSYDDTPTVARHHIWPQPSESTDTLTHAEALAVGRYLHADIIKPHEYQYLVADGGHTAAIQIGEGRIIDDGYRLTAEGELSPEMGMLMHRLAIAKGWQDYEMSDDPVFRATIQRAAKTSGSHKQGMPPKPKPEEARMPIKQNKKESPKQDDKQPSEPWMLMQGGVAALSKPHLESARRSWESWIEQRGGSRQFRFDAYVGYVQQKIAERGGLTEIQGPAEEQSQTDAETRDKTVTARSDDAKLRERVSYVHKLLSERYAVPDELVDFVRRLDINKESGEATLTLKSGGKIIDTGDLLRTIDDQITDDISAATVATAHARGWSAGGLKVTGSDEYRVAIGKAAALHIPPIGTDVELPPAVQREVQAALVERAKAALKDAGNSVAPVSNSVSPAGQPNLTADQAQAIGILDRQQARWQAELAGEPKGLVDHAAIVGPRIAEVDKQLESARQAAQEARQAADDHAHEFPLMRRLLDAGARNRHGALETEATRLEKVAGKLEASKDATVKRLATEARKEAKAAEKAHDDWRYQPTVRRAQKNLADIERMRKGIAVGDPAIIADINAGKLNEAVAKLPAFEEGRVQKAREARTPEQVRGQALDTVMGVIKQFERKPERKHAAEEAMRAAVGGDPATIAALDGGKIDDAFKAAAAWRKKLDEEAAKIKKAKETKEALEAKMAPPPVTVAQP